MTTCNHHMAPANVTKLILHSSKIIYYYCCYCCWLGNINQSLPFITNHYVLVIS